MELTSLDKTGRKVRAVRALAAAVFATSMAMGGCSRESAETKEPIRWVKPLPADQLGTAVPKASVPGRTPAWVYKAPDGGQLTIFGTFHSIRNGTSWASPALLDACPGADLVFLEEPNLKPNDVAALKALTPEGPPWKGLSDAERARLADILLRFKLRLEDYERVDAGRMVLHIESLISASLGQGGPPHVEKWAAASCGRFGEKLRTLEPAGAYTKIIMSLPQEATTAMLRTFIAQPDRQPRIQLGLYDAWVRGDLPEIERLASQDRARWRELGVDEAILGDRNEAWAQKIKTAMSDHRSVLVVVGLSHLVGPDNLIDELRRQNVPATLASPPQ